MKARVWFGTSSTLVVAYGFVVRTVAFGGVNAGMAGPDTMATAITAVVTGIHGMAARRIGQFKTASASHIVGINSTAALLRTPAFVDGARGATAELIEVDQTWSWPGIGVRRTACFRTPMSRLSMSLDFRYLKTWMPSYKLLAASRVYPTCGDDAVLRAAMRGHDDSNKTDHALSATAFFLCFSCETLLSQLPGPIANPLLSGIIVCRCLWSVCFLLLAQGEDPLSASAPFVFILGHAR